VHVKRRLLLTVLFAVAALGALVVLVGKVTSYGRLSESLSGAAWSWLALSALGLSLAYSGYVLGYRAVARVDGGPKLGYVASARVVATSIGAFAVSSAGGPAVEYWSLHRAGATRNDAVTRVIALNALKFFVLGVAAAIASVFVISGAGSDVSRAYTLPWLVGVPVLTVLAVWLSSRRQMRLAGLRNAVGGVAYARRLLTRPRAHPGGVVAFPLYWAGQVLALYGGVRAFGGAVGLSAIVLAFSVGYVATIVPLPAGGSGGVEASMSYALSAVGVALAPALLGVLAYRVVTFWLPLLPVVAIMPSVRRLDRELLSVRERALGPGRPPAPPG
jgi:glycosyltransferase 2 family protein